MFEEDIGRYHAMQDIHRIHDYQVSPNARRKQNHFKRPGKIRGVHGERIQLYWITFTEYTGDNRWGIALTH